MQAFLDSFTNGTPIYLIGQILGLVIAVISFFIYYAKTRSRILLSKLTTDVLNVIQQAMIGAYTGSFLNVIAIFREIVFYYRTQKKWASYKIWLFLFIVLMNVSPILTWAGPISLLPALGSSLAVVGFYLKNPTHTRIIALFAHGLWLVYTIATFNVGATLQNVILITSAICGLVRDFFAKKKEEKAKETVDA